MLSIINQIWTYLSLYCIYLAHLVLYLPIKISHMCIYICIYIYICITLCHMTLYYTNVTYIHAHRHIYMYIYININASVRVCLCFCIHYRQHICGLVRGNLIERASKCNCAASCFLCILSKQEITWKKRHFYSEYNWS